MELSRRLDPRSEGDRAIGAFAILPARSVPEAGLFELLPGMARATCAPSFSSRDPQLAVLWSGSITNRVALCQALGEPIDTPVTDILALLYRRHAADLAVRLRGNFTIAIADHRAGTLLVLCDDSALETIFYELGRKQEPAFVVTNDVKTLLEFAPGEVEEAALPEYFMFGGLSGPRTLLKGVQRLQPLRALELGPAGWRELSDRYQRLQALPVDTTGTPARAVTAVHDLLDACITDALINAGQAWNTLSGGVDSSLIQALLGRHGERRSLSIAVEGAEHHHTYANEVAQLLGTEHRALTLAPDEFVGAITRGILHCGLPGCLRGRGCCAVRI